ncbi:DUF4254 domain-containing protein [Nocardia concava]|uniref:DUF4254 domain-containing protein n=1 Tax=Nocardia concava TaxID=257281 RepID=UPI000311C766|nr:DUF4254 domain-containing protein [Nocardia concava]
MSSLPSKDLLLDACAGSISEAHPLLRAAYELASLHEARYVADLCGLFEIDCARVRLIREIDRWTAQVLPRPFAAATLHTETLGMVVDRLAQFSVDARSSLGGADAECLRHHTWTRLAELSLAYADLSHDLAARTRRIPESVTPRPEAPERGSR